MAKTANSSLACNSGSNRFSKNRNPNRKKSLGFQPWKFSIEFQKSPKKSQISLQFTKIDNQMINNKINHKIIHLRLSDKASQSSRKSNRRRPSWIPTSLFFFLFDLKINSLYFDFALVIENILLGFLFRFTIFLIQLVEFFTV